MNDNELLTRPSLKILLARNVNVIAIIVAAMASFLVVWPVGEYAILDDWAYVKSLEHLHFEGRLVVLDWNAMTLTGHLIWGLLFTKLLGFSFFATKCATYCAGLLLVLTIHQFVKSQHGSPAIALLAGLSLLLNPLFNAHLFMYMTDVTSLMWQWLSLGALSIALRDLARRSGWWVVACSVCWGLAFLTRQHGIGIPLALGAYVVIFDRSLLRRVDFLASAFLPGIAVSVAGVAWHRLSQKPTDALQVMSQAAKDFIFHPPWFDLPYIVWSYAVYGGLFVLPLCVAIGFYRLPLLKRWRIGLVLGSGIIGLNLFVYHTLRGWYFPYVHNVISPWGMFHPNEFAIQEITAPLWSLEWGIVIGLVGVISAIWFLTMLCQRGRATALSKDTGGDAPAGSVRVWQLLLLLLAFQWTYVVATTPLLFDRHLLLFAPTMIALAAMAVPSNLRPHRIASSAVLTFYGVYGAVCAHDIHAVSRAVFLEGARLIETGIDCAQIDAGYAFDGWFMYERSAAVRTPPLIQFSPWWPTVYPRPKLKSYGSPWWIGGLATQTRPEYVVTAAAPVPDHMFEGRLQFEELEGQERFLTYWPWKERQVRVFRVVPSVAMSK